MNAIIENDFRLRLYTIALRCLVNSLVKKTFIKLLGFNVYFERKKVTILGCPIPP